MPAITLSIDEKHIAYLRECAEKEARDMSTIVELALDLRMAQDKKAKA